MMATKQNRISKGRDGRERGRERGKGKRKGENVKGVYSWFTEFTGRHLQVAIWDHTVLPATRHK